LRKYIKLLLPIGAALICACSMLIHPYGDVKGPASRASLMSDASMGDRLIKIVDSSCKNCHSEKTDWPWYSYIAPMSWMIEGDVSGGRKHMNLSHWDDYDIDQKQVVLSKIAVMVKNHKMPLPRYLVLHPEAKLSAGDIDQIAQWARNERRRLTTLAATNPSNSSGASQ
jgi:Haem-binding domain